MKYKVLKEAVVQELMNEDWEGHSQEEREKTNHDWGESGLEVLKPRHLTKTEMRNLPKHVTDRRQQLADLDAEEKGENVPVADKGDGFNEYSDVADDWDSYKDNSDIVRLRHLNDTPMSQYAQLKDWVDLHADKASALLNDVVGLSRLFDLVDEGDIGRRYAVKLIRYATGKRFGVHWNDDFLGPNQSAPGRTERRTKRIGDW